MPTYEYVCDQGHRSERVRLIDDRHDPLDCDFCGCATKLAVSMPQLGLYWHPDLQEHRSKAMIDNVQDIWEGTGLEDSDGINPELYKSDKRSTVQMLDDTVKAAVERAT